MKRALPLLLALALAGCAAKPLAPAEVKAPVPVVVAARPSWDGNRQDSGVISAGPTGFVVSAGFVAAYRNLLERFGDKVAVKPAPDRGLKANPDGTFLADAQVMVDRANLLRVAKAVQP